MLSITSAPKKLTPARYLDSALKSVQSPSIRKWAGEGANRKPFIKLAAKSMATRSPAEFAAYIVILAMG